MSHQKDEIPNHLCFKYNNNSYHLETNALEGTAGMRFFQDVSKKIATNNTISIQPSMTGKLTQILVNQFCDTETSLSRLANQTSLADFENFLKALMQVQKMEDNAFCKAEQEHDIKKGIGVGLGLLGILALAAAIFFVICKKYMDVAPAEYSEIDHDEAELNQKTLSV